MENLVDLYLGKFYKIAWKDEPWTKFSMKRSLNQNPAVESFFIARWKWIWVHSNEDWFDDKFGKTSFWYVDLRLFSGDFDGNLKMWIMPKI